jgi:hypothetical protein
MTTKSLVVEHSSLREPRGGADVYGLAPIHAELTVAPRGVTWTPAHRPYPSGHPVADCPPTEQMAIAS